MADSPDVPDLRDVLASAISEKRACMVPNCSGCRAEADHYLAAIAANPRALAEWAPPDVIDAVIDRAIDTGVLDQCTCTCGMEQRPSDRCESLYRRAERSGT